MRVEAENQCFAPPIHSPFNCPSVAQAVTDALTTMKSMSSQGTSDV